MARHRFWSLHREYELRSFGEPDAGFELQPLDRREAVLALDRLRREERSDVRALAEIHRHLLPRARSAVRRDDPIAFFRQEWLELERAVETGLVRVYARALPVRTWVKRPEGAPTPAQPLGPADDASETTWIVIELVDDDGEPLPGERYRVRTPDGRVIEGSLDRHGRARIDGIERGECDVTFPELDGREWKAA